MLLLHVHVGVPRAQAPHVVEDELTDFPQRPVGVSSGVKCAQGLLDLLHDITQPHALDNAPLLKQGDQLRRGLKEDVTGLQEALIEDLKLLLTLLSAHRHGLRAAGSEGGLRLLLLDLIRLGWDSGVFTKP